VAAVVKSGSVRCIPPEDAVVYRCGEELPPVAAVRGEDGVRRRFLGGRYAVSIPRIPGDAFELGRAGDRRLYVVPGDPHWLYVGTPEGPERWLVMPIDRLAYPRLPAPSVSSSLSPSVSPTTSPSVSLVTPTVTIDFATVPSATIVGDSIMAASTELMTEFLPGWSLTFDTEIGRGSSSGIPIAESIATSLDPSDIVVIELGTNDADADTFRENAEQILDALTDRPLVIWQTAHGPLEEIQGVNEAIMQLAATFPNVAVADWDRHIREDALSGDGIHPTPEGLLQVPALLVPFMRAWAEAAAGRGATRCAARAEHSG
jgi:hypothetical protein